MNFGGHAQACGLTIKTENILPFRDRLNEADSVVKENAARIDIEAEISLQELNLKFLEALNQLAPFGPGNRKPLFLSRDLRMRGPAKKRGKDTLQCWMTDREGKTTCEIVAFRAFSRWMENKPQGSYDIVYQPVLKEWNGIVTIQLELEDWQPASNCVSAL